MKKLSQLTALLIMIVLISCGKEKNSSTTTNSKISSYLTNIKKLEDITVSPIKTITTLAEESASKSISLEKSSIKESLLKVQDYKHALIIVENHTVVKIINLKDCKQSGSWGACMPMGEGYIKKGNLNHKKDYLNNIIGLPDNQDRTLYLFN